MNPHGTGSYLVVHETTVGDFVLDFDYKLSKGCNSGVFLRVSDLNDPVNTGIEVALDDTTGTGMHDPARLYDLVAPSENAQKAGRRVEPHDHHGKRAEDRGRLERQAGLDD